MYILKNAFTSITRNKGRNILIGIIILVIACATTVSLSIMNAADKIVASNENKYDITATIGVNRQKMMENFDPTDETSKENIKQNFNSLDLTIDEINSYGDSNYISSYYYTYSIGLNSSTIEKAESTSNDAGHGPDKKMESDTDFTLTGYSSYDAMTEFIEGKYTITDGEVSSNFDSNDCIINSELATLNSIKVGDTITLINPNDETKTYELIVTGIYSDNDTETSGMNMFTNSVNTIITNSNYIQTILDSDTSLNGTLSPTFILKNKDDIDKFQNELYEKGLDDTYIVNTNLDQISSETSSISNVSTFAKTFLIVTLIIGGIVLFILNLINVRERKYEIGVLRTIGMKKSNVIVQFVTELLIVSIVALLLGGLLGSVLSVPTANKLLENEINTASEQQTTIQNNFGGHMSENTQSNKVPSNGVANIEYVSEINAVVNIKILLELLGIGIFLTLISSISAMVSISKFSPLTILKERS